MPAVYGGTRIWICIIRREMYSVQRVEFSQLVLARCDSDLRVGCRDMEVIVTTAPSASAVCCHSRVVIRGLIPTSWFHFIFIFSLEKLVLLSNLSIQHGSWTHNPTTQSLMLHSQVPQKACDFKYLYRENRILTSISQCHGFSENFFLFLSTQVTLYLQPLRGSAVTLEYRRVHHGPSQATSLMTSTNLT